mgnify:CR=1 FL=1
MSKPRSSILTHSIPGCGDGSGESHGPGEARASGEGHGCGEGDSCGEGKGFGEGSSGEGDGSGEGDAKMSDGGEHVYVEHVSQHSSPSVSALSGGVQTKPSAAANSVVG